MLGWGGIKQLMHSQELLFDTMAMGLGLMNLLFEFLLSYLWMLFVLINNINWLLHQKTKQEHKI
jgi:hypothetical protein